MRPDETDPPEHAWAQLRLRIGHDGLHEDVARNRIHSGVYGMHPTLELPMREGVDAHIDRLADPHAGHVDLRDSEVDIERAIRLKIDDRCPGGQVLAEIDLADA